MKVVTWWDLEKAVDKGRPPLEGLTWLQLIGQMLFLLSQLCLLLQSCSAAAAVPSCWWLWSWDAVGTTQVSTHLPGELEQELDLRTSLPLPFCPSCPLSFPPSPLLSQLVSSASRLYFNTLISSSVPAASHRGWWAAADLRMQVFLLLSGRDCCWLIDKKVN